MSESTPFQVNQAPTGTVTLTGRFGASAYSLPPKSTSAVWNQDGSGSGVRLDQGSVLLRSFDSTGQTQGAEVTVSAPASSTSAAITRLANGQIVVAWMDTATDAIQLRLFDAALSPIGSAQSLPPRHPGARGGEASLSLLSLDSGGFVLTWNDIDSDNWGTYAQLFNATGAATSAASLVNTTTFANQLWPASTTTADGGFVVAWMSGGQKGNHLGRVPDLRTAL